MAASPGIAAYLLHCHYLLAAGAGGDDRYELAMQSGKKVRALDFIILIHRHVMYVLQRFIAGKNGLSLLAKSTESPFDA